MEKCSLLSRLFPILLLFMTTGVTASAYDAMIDDVYYNFNLEEKTAEVTYYDSDYDSSQDATKVYYGDVIIPSSVVYNSEEYAVTSIGKRAFSKCRNMTSLVIGDNVRRIGKSAFKDCRGLVSVILPVSLTEIDELAFDDCSALTSVVIPNSVTIIGRRAFRQCRGLMSVTIGSGVTSIGEEAFYDCYRINMVLSLIETPFVLDESVFVCRRDENENTLESDLVYNTAMLYVPNGKVDIYSQTEGWKKFFHIKEASFASIETTKTFTEGTPQGIFTMDGRAAEQHVKRSKGLRIVRNADGSVHKVMITE